MTDLKLSILLVEDSSLDARMFTEFLRRSEIAACEIIVATTVNDAVCKLREARFELVVLDLNLPDSRGLETFYTIQKATEIPVVIFTGSSDDAVTSQAIMAGAQDYIVKGETDKHSLIRSLRFAIERSKRAQVEQQLRQQQREIELLHKLQEALLPSSPRLEFGNIKGSAVICPAERASGDCCDILQLRDSKVLCYVADVSGHGIRASQLMLSVRSTIRAIAKYTSDPEEIIVTASNLMLADFSSGHFVTMLVAEVDTIAETVTYASAGHEGYHIHAKGEFEVLESMYPPIGIEPFENRQMKQVRRLSTNDLLVLPTDGIVETFNTDGQMLGVEQFMSMLLELRHREPFEIVQDAIRCIADFRGERPQLDDVSLVLVKLTSPNASEATP